MSSCAILGNVPIEDMSMQMKADLYSIIWHLITKEKVSFFFITEDNDFSSVCEDILRRIKIKKTLYEFEVLRLKEPRKRLFETFDTSSDYYLCDSTTKTMIMDHIDVDFIVEKPKSKIFAIAKYGSFIL